MMLYHGSCVEVSAPDVLHSRSNVDFGKGFYVTPIYDQAKKWAEKFARRGKPAIVSKYSFDEKALEECKVCVFDTYSAEWLAYILECRSGRDKSDYDIVIGGVANDKVFNTVELFFDGLIDQEEAIKRLKYEKPNLQIAFRSQSTIDRYLHFEGSEQL
ncbi:MAG: DUF3990 domain-containing protein [Oscillospiraceae bacterium]|nr:DUF3990 domain-containing protein [Oscillospiraceae bacterium]